MCENLQDGPEANESMLEIAKNLIVGRRNRQFKKAVRELAVQHGYDADKMEQFLLAAGTPSPYKEVEVEGEAGSFVLMRIDRSDSESIKTSVSRWMSADVEYKKRIAEGIGVDWEGLSDFMEAMVPLIIELMEVSAAMATNNPKVICTMALEYASELQTVMPEFYAKIASVANAA